MTFEPIAIIGSSCVLPGALSPGALWEAVRQRRDLISVRPDTGRAGGYVAGFESAFRFAELDPLFHWLLHSAHEAFASAGVELEPAAARTGAIFGNLSYPSAGLSQFAQNVWSGVGRRPDARNRFNSGLPARLLEQAFGLQAGVFALDAACASSLYAMKFACDRLHDGRADLMLAGGVNAAEMGFIQKGFEALKALSPSGRSRPFHREADGLVPAEGAAFVLLKRLDDALRDGNTVLGIIRGVGLSNDGRGTGFLSPSSAGQIEAMRAAYRSAQVDPASVELIECHATGTIVGDTTEIESMKHVFNEARDPIPIGSLKSNMGHSITAAGAAGVIKILEAFKAEMLPPTLHSGAELAALKDAPLRLLTSTEPWRARGVRRAAVSGFGFGGVNAHLILDGPGGAPSRAAARATRPAEDKTRRRVAIVAVETLVAGDHAKAGLLDALSSGKTLLGKRADGSPAGARNKISFSAGELRFPPKDLERTLPQQLLALKAAVGALAEAGGIDHARTGVYVGMQCDPGAVAKGLLAPGELLSADVIGCMPNVVASRINSQFDLRGPGLTVSAEERSGVEAFALAVRALDHGEIDAALVGAVDLSCEPVHEAAMRGLPGGCRQRVPGDAAVALVLKRLDDAERDGNTVYAVVGDAAALEHQPLDTPLLLEPLVGHAHAASGLLNIACAALACRHALRPVEGTPGLQPWFATSAERALRVEGVVLQSAAAAPLPLAAGSVPAVHLFTKVELAELGEGRLAILASDNAELLQKKTKALETLRRSRAQDALTEIDDGVFFSPRAVAGDVALVFTGAAAAYSGMGRELFLAFPELVAGLAGRMGQIRHPVSWIYDQPQTSRATMGPSEKLWATSYLSQLHAALCFEWLGLKPQAAIGLSSGETNALFAFGAWTDMEAMHDEIVASGIYGRELSGEFQAARRAWKTSSAEWSCWSVRVSEAEIRKALEGERRVYLMIVNSPTNVLIGGERADCARVVEKVGAEKAALSSFSLAVHCPVVNEFAPQWRKIHTRQTNAVPGVRFYTHATGRAYQATRDAAADALLGQALVTVDFPALIRNASKDGVRVFVEAGPGDYCSSWIRETLGADGARDYAAVSLDRRGRSGLNQLLHAAAALACAGVAIDLDRLKLRLAELAPPRPAPKPTSAAEPLPPTLQKMPRAPALPGVKDEQMPLFEDPQLALRELASSTAPLIAVQRGMAQAHQQFMDEQARAHERFLRLPFGGEARSIGEASVGPELVFTREQLERLASDKISAVFGPLFAVQDGFRRQVRMPEPPLLLADRITAIEAEPGVLATAESAATGRLVSETDVLEGSWYLNSGYMPPGIMIEAGQADLLLISWLGADFLNRGERVYRLLGCDLTYYGALAQPGETLTYEIHIDGHADHQGMRIFFFHSECRVNGELRQTVRNGQAGFFSDDELSRSAGVLWTPESETLEPDGRVDAPAVVCEKTSFSAQDVRAFSESDVRACFGRGFERAQTHIQTPKIQGGAMLLIEEVSLVDTGGGPWGRGYLRARKTIEPETWFFKGHFKDDPCMPGTLMFDGCLQAMSFYLARLGYTLDKDGWRFEPVLETQYDLRCRGQVTPSSRELTYEVFVREVISGPEPTLHADVLCTVDGLKAFHARKLAIKLRRDWPLTTRPELRGITETRAVAVSEALGAFEFGESALLANALGSPVEAFGPLYADFEERRGYGFPRLPAPPFLFLTRLARLEGEPRQAGPGVVAEFEYDITPDAWYFSEKGTPSVPLCVIVEAALQPCVWISAFMGVPDTVEHLVQCRNLGGTARWFEELSPDAGVLTVRSTVTGTALFGGTEIQNCDIECFAGGRKVFEIKSVSGNFSVEALAAQTGLPASPEEERRFRAPSEFRQDVLGIERRGLCLPEGPLLMIDRITGLWPGEGKAGLGRIRSEKDIRPDAWYFKAHFPNDPVQPGSLGLEAIVQTLKFYMMHEQLDAGIENPRFEPIALGEEISWKYRGQILHTHSLMTVEVELTKKGRDERGAFVFADAWLWADGRRIYEAKNFGMRIINDG